MMLSLLPCRISLKAAVMVVICMTMTLSPGTEARPLGSSRSSIARRSAPKPTGYYWKIDKESGKPVRVQGDPKKEFAENEGCGPASILQTEDNASNLYLGSWFPWNDYSGLDKSEAGDDMGPLMTQMGDILANEPVCKDKNGGMMQLAIDLRPNCVAHDRCYGPKLANGKYDKDTQTKCDDAFNKANKAMCAGVATTRGILPEGIQGFAKAAAEVMKTDLMPTASSPEDCCNQWAANMEKVVRDTDGGTSDRSLDDESLDDEEAAADDEETVDDEEETVDDEEETVDDEETFDDEQTVDDFDDSATDDSEDSYDDTYEDTSSVNDTGYDDSAETDDYADPSTQYDDSSAGYVDDRSAGYVDSGANYDDASYMASGDEGGW